jgi:hypothetical protein
MSEEIFKAIKKNKTAYYHWKLIDRSTNPLDTLFIEKKRIPHVY